MKANNFVKQFGIDYTVNLLNDKVWSLKQVMAATLVDDMQELKHLVKSHDLVKRLGGLDSAVNELNYRREQGILQSYDSELSQAISDVESCQ